MSHGKYVSFTRLDLYETCPRAYECRYIVREAQPEKAVAPAFGTVVHQALEHLVADAVRLGVPGPLSNEKAEHFYAEAWTESGLTGAPLFADGLAMVLRVVQEEGLFDPSTVLGVEVPFEIQVGGRTLLGKIDRVDRLDHETIDVQDYKTNQQFFARDELEGSLQLSIYALAARELWPWAKKIQLTYRMVRHGVNQRTERSGAQLDTAALYVATLADTITSVSTFPAKPGVACVYCDYRSTCPAYADALAGRRKVAVSDVHDLEAVAQERAEVAQVAKVAYARKEELDKVLKAHLKEQDELVAAGTRFVMIKTESKEYPLARTAQKLAEATGASEAEMAARLGTVDKDALDGVFKELGKTMPRSRLYLLRADVDAGAERSFTPRLWAKEVKSCAA